MADPSDVGPDGEALDVDDPSPEPTLDRDAVAQRAYALSQSEDGGTDEENWLRAEQELRTQAPPAKSGGGRRRKAAT